MRTARSEHHGASRHAWLNTLSDLLWSLAGAAVLAFAFFAALGAFDPTDAFGLTVAVALLAVLWLAHARLRLR